MKKLLLTGASGFLGWNICRLAGSGWEIFGAFFSHSIKIDFVKTFQLDITRFGDLKETFHKIRPDLVIHTAAASNANFCQTHPVETHRVNVEASGNIAGLCSDHSSDCIFTSTDLVFDGLNPPYGEEDPVCPVSIYGEQKVMAEEAMRKRCPWVMIFRLPLMFGDPGPSAESFVQPMLSALRNGDKLRLFTDEFRTPISGKTASRGLLTVCSKASGRTVHLGGMERVSRYDFGLMLTDVFRLLADGLEPCSRKDVPMAAPRPADVSLLNGKAVEWGFRPLPIRRELADLYSSSGPRPDEDRVGVDREEEKQ
jgi:dTDP-4-dehydrorhamnose reductase